METTFVKRSYTTTATPALMAHMPFDRAAERLFVIYDLRPKSFVAKFSKNPALGTQEDIFVDFWLFQLSAARGTDPIRALAYTANPADDVAQTCHQIRRWGPGVTLWTRTRVLATAYVKECGDRLDVLWVPPGLTPRHAVTWHGPASGR